MKNAEYPTETIISLLSFAGVVELPSTISEEGERIFLEVESPFNHYMLCNKEVPDNSVVQIIHVYDDQGAGFTIPFHPHTCFDHAIFLIKMLHDIIHRTMEHIAFKPNNSDDKGYLPALTMLHGQYDRCVGALTTMRIEEVWQQLKIYNSIGTKILNLPEIIEKTVQLK